MRGAGELQRLKQLKASPTHSLVLSAYRWAGPHLPHETSSSLMDRAPNVSDSGAQEPEVLEDVCGIDVVQREVTPVSLLAIYYDTFSCLQ